MTRRLWVPLGVAVVIAAVGAVAIQSAWRAIPSSWYAGALMTTDVKQRTSLVALGAIIECVAALLVVRAIARYRGAAPGTATAAGFVAAIAVGIVVGWLLSATVFSHPYGA